MSKDYVVEEIFSGILLDYTNHELSEEQVKNISNYFLKGLNNMSVNPEDFKMTQEKIDNLKEVEKVKITKEDIPHKLSKGVKERIYNGYWTLIKCIKGKLYIVTEDTIFKISKKGNVKKIIKKEDFNVDIMYEYDTGRKPSKNCYYYFVNPDPILTEEQMAFIRSSTRQDHIATHSFLDYESEDSVTDKDTDIIIKSFNELKSDFKINRMEYRLDSTDMECVFIFLFYKEEKKQADSVKKIINFQNKFIDLLFKNKISVWPYLEFEKEINI